MGTTRTSSTGFHPVALLAGTAVLLAGVAIARSLVNAWVTDDAFISFRYALNLVEGRGLVFNAGERVEGFTNLLWTLWGAAAIRLGIDPIRWALGWGVAAYAAAVVLLAVNHRTLRTALGLAGFTLPAGAIVAVSHREWSVYATGGLETAAFTCLAVVGFFLLTREAPPRGGRVLAGGLVFGLAAVTRPDGVIFAAVAGLWVLWNARRDGRPWLRDTAAFALAFGLVWLPLTLGRVAYYGDLFPNSYYAKSAYLSWYSQGWHYLRLFFWKYWVLLAAIPLVLVGAGRVRRHASSAARRVWFGQALLALGFVLVYTFYVARVGGDFMFGRLLIPTVPFWAILIDLGLIAVFGTRPLLHLASVLGIVAGLVVTPQPIPGRRIVHGIADEPRHYTAERVRETDHAAEVLKRYLGGLNVTVAFTGSEARLVYLAQVPRAIECETGLTDRVIAHQELERRGRPGHEKHAPLEYLIGEGRADLAFDEYTLRITGADQRLPVVPILFDDVQGYILRWNPQLLEELRRRGARFEDFPPFVDRVIGSLDRMPDAEASRAFEMIKLFYFDHVEDPERRLAFERRLGL